MPRLTNGLSAFIQQFIVDDRNATLKGFFCELCTTPITHAPQAVLSHIMGKTHVSKLKKKAHGGRRDTAWNPQLHPGTQGQERARHDAQIERYAGDGYYWARVNAAGRNGLKLHRT
jgi:hypothetical protein